MAEPFRIVDPGDHRVLETGAPPSLALPYLNLVLRKT
jgi:hypothetical protein